MTHWLKEREEVLTAARKMLEKGLVVGTSGNVSRRLVAGRRQLLAITPSSLPYDSLTPEDIQVVDFTGRKVAGSLPPSMETPLHIGIYRHRREINAVVHTHSIHASALAVAGREIPPILDDQVALLGGSIRLAAHAPSGNDRQVAAVLAALEDRCGVLLANHGALAIGRTLAEALTAAELLEKTSKIYFLATMMGSPHELPTDALQAARHIYERLQGDPSL